MRGAPRRAGPLRDDRGSAVAETAMVLGLLTLVALAIVQLALALHVRTVLQDAAAEGARYGALAGADAEAGVARAEELAGTALGPSIVRSASSRASTLSGHPTLEVTIVGTMPLVGLLGPTGMEVHGSAAIETLG